MDNNTAMRKWEASKVGRQVSVIDKISFTHSFGPLWIKRQNNYKGNMRDRELWWQIY